MLRVFARQSRASYQLRLQPIRAFAIRPSLVTQDRLLASKTEQIKNSNPVHLKFSQAIPDYEIDFEDTVITTSTREKFDYYKEHPLETTVRANRQKENVYSGLQDNQLIFTNLPVPCKQLSSLENIRDYLHQKVHKDLDVTRAEYFHAVVAPGETPRLAYIKVTVGNKRQAYMAKSALRKEWLEDCLVKVKVTEDVQREHFNNRTILIREIPRYLRMEHVLSMFGTKYGAVTNVELPTENIAIKKITQEQQQRIGTRVDDEKVAQIRQAELQIKQSLAVDQEYQAFLAENLDQETAASVLSELREDLTLSPPEALDQERMNSLLTMITHLQAEGARCQERKLDLLELKTKTSVEGNEFSEATADQSTSFVKQNKDKLKAVLTYLERTRSSQAVANKAEDSLAHLLTLTKGELMYAYDELLKELELRESLLNERLKDSIQYFDENERILLEGRDFQREVDHVGNPFEAQLNHIEQIISVNQQIQDTYQLKNLSSEQVLHQYLRKELNPFITGNFLPERIEEANTDLAKKWKHYTLPDIFETKTGMRRKGLKSQFRRRYQKSFDEMLERARNDLEVPFDEIYHREKHVIGAVIDAQKRLEQRQAQMRSPLEHRLLDEKLLTAEQRAQIQHVLDEVKPRYEQSLNREQERALNLQIEKLDKQLGMVGKYQFAASDEQRWRAMVQAGELSESDLQKLIQMRKENETQNLGYCFITFSHADEARLMLLQNKKPYFLEDKSIEFDLKAAVDHGDLDMQYTVNRSKNDSHVTEEIENLRNAKKELREFERSMDKDLLPENRRLKKFREQAKALLEDHEFESRESKIGGKITERDQARFDRKIRELEQKYPNVNFTQLYASDQAEAAKQALHKKAYASYKAFQFLKHGIKTSKDEEEPSKLSKAQQRVMDNDPYNFPMMDDTVYKLLSKDVTAPTAIDKGDRINRPGRKTSISVQDYLESQFGKDMLRQPRQSIKDDDMFTFQETLKKRYPAEQYLKLADVEKKLQRLDDLGLDFDYKKFPQLKLKNDYVQRAIDENQQDLYEQAFGDKKIQYVHPKDPTRTFANDIQERMKASMEKHEAINLTTLNRKDYSRNFAKLKREYGIQMSKNRDTETMQSRFMEALNANQLRPKRRTKAQKMAILARRRELKAKKLARKGSKFEASYDGEDPLQTLGLGKQPLDESQTLLNNEFFYAQKTRPTNDRLNITINEKLQKDYEKKSAQERLEQDAPEQVDYREWLRDEAHLRQAGGQYGGKLYREARLGVDRVSDRFSQQKTGKGLETFFEEDGELDVYEEYKRQTSQPPKTQDNDKFNKFKIDQQALQPDMPRFDSFFDSKSKGLHPFESITNSFDDSEIRTNDDDDFEALEEEALYRRELMGRLMGQKLTPRQFEVLTGGFRSTDTRSERYAELSKHQFLDQRDTIRLVEEHIEKHRRKQVLKGNWNEEESQDRTKEWLTQMIEESTPSTQKKQIYRDTAALYEAMRQMDNPESLFEKEYHFDEGLGMSLADHMDKLRKEYPGATVLSRRDRDGYAIVKVQFRPEYKYNFDLLVNYDQENEMERFNSAIELLLEKITMGKGVSEKLNQELLQNEIQKLTSDPKLVPDLSAFAKFKITQLVQERMHGIYREDDQAFVDALMALMKSETGKESAKTQEPGLVDLTAKSQKTTVEAIFDDRDRFRTDIADQLRRRIIKYRNFTKRTAADFIKPRVNENEALMQQQTVNDAHIDHLEQKSIELEGNQNKEEFDKEAYYKLKEELRQRKEAKERLLSQGLPQFKAYMRF